MAVSGEAVLDPLEVSRATLARQLTLVRDGRCEKLSWRAAECREHFRILWSKEAHILAKVFPLFGDVRFFHVLYN